MDLVPLLATAGGGWLFAAADPTWGVLDPAARVPRRHVPARLLRSRISAKIGDLRPIEA